MVKFSKCCNPIPGDEIVGYITYGKGVSVHRSDCSNLKSLDIESRRINVRWQDKVEMSFITNIQIRSNDRNDIVSDVLKKIQDLKVYIISISAKKTIDKECIIDLSINVESSEKLQKVIKEIRKIDSIFEVKRSK
ncbi:GTP pyrophosphokinase [compost metagenome]